LSISCISIPDNSWLIGSCDVTIEEGKVSVATCDGIVVEVAIKAALVGVSRGCESLRSIIASIFLAGLDNSVWNTEVLLTKKKSYASLESREVHVAEAGESFWRDKKIVVQVELWSVEPTSWEAREVTDRAVTVDIFETVGTDAAVAWVHVCAMGSDGTSVISALIDVGASAINIVVAVAFLKAFTHECSLVVLADAVSCASAVVGSALVDIDASVIDDVISSIAAALIARVRVDTFVGCGTVMSSALAQALISVDAFVILVNESIWTWLEATGVV
jgi:hypothetical protein